MDKLRSIKTEESPLVRDSRTWNISRISGKSVGEILEETRREQNLTIGEASKAINVHPSHLRALEDGDYKNLPGGVYSEKILESYADLLNIDLEGLKKNFEKEAKILHPPKKNTFAPKISSRNFIVTPRLVKISAIVIVVILLLTYLGFEINNIFAPPALTITSPLDNLVTNKPTIEVTGRTEKEVKIRINDQEIQADVEGNFRESVSLQPGLNVIKISAVKKRGKENVIYRQIILKE
jgi:cytoskeletal protein RodZ